MTLAIILVAVAILSLIIVLSLAFKRSRLIAREDRVAAGIRPIDLEAFRNLVDPAEDEYLRRRLSYGQYRVVRRERLRAIAAYVQVVSANATVLVHAGQAALASGDPRYTVAAQQLVNDALLLRRNATLALMRIYVALAWPGSGVGAVRVADRYEHLSGSAMLLGRLQNPAVPVRLSARF